MSEVDWTEPDDQLPAARRHKSRRGLWLKARQRSGKLRNPWTVETTALKAELERREAAELRYYKDVRRYGPTSVVTARNREMILLIKLVLEQRDGISDDIPF